MIQNIPSRRVLVALLACAATTPALAAATLLVHGRLHTETSAGTVEDGSLLIVDGRIRAIGRDVKAPDGAEIIDLKGAPVTPALFGGIGDMGVVEVSGEHTTNDSSLHLGEMRPEFDPAPAFNPDAIPVEVARVEGVGFALLAPSAAEGHKGAPGSTLVAGLAEVVSLDGRGPRAPSALAVVLGGEAQGLSGDNRAASYMLLSQALEEARHPPAAGEPRLLTNAGRKVLAQVTHGTLPLLVGVDRASDIRAVLAFAAREHVRVVIQGGAEAWRVAAELAAARVPVVLNPLEDLPESFDQIGATLDNARRLAAQGVPLAFTLKASSHEARKLRQAAGIAVAHGLPWDAALAAITRAPAEVFGASDEFGSLTVGAKANLVVWTGDPLEVTSLVTAEWLDGTRRSLVTRQTLLRDRYAAKVKAHTAR
jgi:Amidohydrolase family